MPVETEPVKKVNSQVEEFNLKNSYVSSKAQAYQNQGSYQSSQSTHSRQQRSLSTNYEAV